MSAGIDIALKHGSSAEQETAAQLNRLLGEYDLSAWRFTPKVAIDERSIPHSHPVLTLHTRHLHDDLLLLSTYIHEQSHWCFTDNRAATEAAVAELETLFPGLPDGFPDGADSHHAT